MARVVFRPRVSRRMPSKTWFAELATATGPQAIGVTGDNSYAALFGREWLLEWSVEDGMLRLYQESPTHPGEWERVDSPLPPVFDSPLPATARRVTFAFDQSARMIFAYEDEGVVKVTRWDPSSNQYVQNVSFAGVDPQLFMDATLADPAGFPEDVRAAAQAGVRVLFEWLPDGSWRESAISDSDVVLFYLTTDRKGIRARAQRQLYQTVHALHDYDEPVILDRALPLPGAYELLVSDASGAARESALVSDPYIGEFLLAPAATDEFAGSTTPENIRVDNDTYATTDDDDLTAALNADNLAVVGSQLNITDDDRMNGGISPEPPVVTGSIFAATDDDGLTGALAPDDSEAWAMNVNHEQTDELTGGVTLEGIRVQASS